MKIINRLPYFPEPTTIVVHGETVRVKPYQIVVQVSLTLQSILEWNPRTPSFPAILDTGNNHHFSIRKDHLIRWAGLEPNSLPIKGNIRDRQQRVPLHAGVLWLHPNAPGKLATSGAEAFLMKVREGIAVYPDETGPRLPVLGLRTLTQNQLFLTLDGRHRQVSLRSTDWVTTLWPWAF